MPYIEDVARRLAVANFIAFAPDALTSVGGYPGDDEKALALFSPLDRGKLAEAPAGRSARDGWRQPGSPSITSPLSMAQR